MKIYYFFMALTLLVAVYWVDFSYSASDLQNELDLDKCQGQSNEIYCVAKVLLKNIKDIKRRLSATQENDFSMKVDFYNSKDCSKKLQTSVFYTQDSDNNASICQFKSKFITTKTLSIKINEICKDIKKIDFLTACEKYYK